MSNMGDATASLGKGMKKSMRNCGKEIGQFAQSFSGFVNFDAIVKTIHKARSEVRRKSSSNFNYFVFNSNMCPLTKINTDLFSPGIQESTKFINNVYFIQPSTGPSILPPLT